MSYQRHTETAKRAAVREAAEPRREPEPPPLRAARETRNVEKEPRA